MEKQSFRILLLVDEPDILEMLSYSLRREGYQIAISNNREEVARIALQFTPHLIILDAMRSDSEGIETLKKIRAHEPLQRTIVCFLTTYEENYHRIVNLGSGADDYITVPIRTRVLMSRIAALLGGLPLDKPKVDTIHNAIPAGGLIIDPDTCTVTQNDTQFHLPKIEFKLLHLLAGNPGKVFSREKILKEIWGSKIRGSYQTINVHISKLREKIGSSRIKTVKGIGYKFE